MPQPAEICASAEAVFRREHGQIIASLIRLCGSFDRAEEAMQEAFAAALHHWAEHGVPDNPAAWITAAAYRKLIDARRRERTRREKLPLLEYEAALTNTEEPVLPETLPSEIPDDRLRLIFTCCHPALNREAQIALTLRTLGGLSTGEIARAFLVPEPIPWRNGWCVQSARSRKRAFRTKYRRLTHYPSAGQRCRRSST